MRVSRFSLLFSHFFLTVFAAGAALANDSTASLGAGGLTLTQSADIRMASEDLSISRESVRVRYEFVNESGAPIATRVAFPLPEANLEELSESDVGWPTDNEANLIDFKVTVDGKKVRPQLEEKAFLKGVDVSDVLRRYKIPFVSRPWAAVEVVKKLPPAAKKDLVKRGLAEISDDYATLKWTVKNTFHWQQTFPADRPLKVEHSYKPVVGGTMISASGFFQHPEAMRWEEFFERFCVDKPTHAAIAARLRAQQKKQGEGAIILGYYVDYVLTTGKNWKGPIGKFRLTVDKGRADNVVSFCADGVKKTGPTTFVVEYKDFEPETDLHVLIVGAPRD
ncbi:MAG: DUF4424 domain-containing protein [Alphaproteobacteria bacterium]|jgi:hypothetical protein|nr:DUF4424 domain-containing protein [Alphaproteobacteria bacterium]